MHRLLERQLRKATAADGEVDLAKLLAMVDASYAESDRERRIKDRAFDMMQTEVEALNRRVREEAEARFNVVMNNVGEAVVIIDGGGLIESFNAAAETIFGYGADEVCGRNVAILMEPKDAAEHDARLARYLRTGEKRIIGQEREATAQRKSGEVFPVELAIGEVRIGPQRHFVGVIRDISLRKQAEQELRESESRFRDLAGSASDWFWETDGQHRLSFVSERIGAVLGVKPVALLGLTHFDLGLQDSPAVAARHQADLDARAPFRDVVFHVGTTGGERDDRFIRISGIPVFADGKFAGYRGVGADVTRELRAESRASAAQQRLTDAIESILDGIAVYDADDRLVVCNSEYRRLFKALHDVIVPGVSFETVVRSHPEIFNTEDRPVDDWMAWRLEHHRQASGVPFTVRTADGRWILNREYRMADGGVVGIRTDITELKRREHEIEALKRRYQLILDSAGQGIVGLDARGRVTFANHAAGRLIEHDPADMVGHCFHALTQVMEEKVDCLRSDSPVTDAYRNGVAHGVKAELFLLSGGRTLPVDYYVAPIMEEGEVAGAVVLFHDATMRLQYERSLADNQRELERLVAERTQALSQEVDIRTRTEAALRESRGRLKAITDSLFEGVLVVNRDGYLVFINPSARRLLDCDDLETDLIGYPVDEIFQIAGVGEGFADSPWARVAQGGGIVRDDDAVFITASGHKLMVAYACAALEEGAEVSGAIISFRDVEALRKAQREALQASRMASVGQLAAGIAHEINTPTQYIGDNLRFIADSLVAVTKFVAEARTLAEQAAANGLHGPAAAFEDAYDSGDIAYVLEEIPAAVGQSLDGVAQVARIVSSMKEFSHPGTTSRVMVDINHALDTTLTVSRNTWKHVADVVRDFAPALPPVPCYPGELNQVFLNLIINAVHAIEGMENGERGCITITTEVDGGDVVIEVADNGPGVPEAIRDQIFDPFFTTKPVGKGTGQGLSICRDVVVGKHGGSLEVGGREGAVFTIRLPVEPVTDSQAEEAV